MKLVRKYYFYIIEFIVGNFIFNLIFSICKTLKLLNIGATKENFIENFKNSFLETLVVYFVIYLVLVIIQILYDKYIVNKLNEKLKKQMKGGNGDEQ